MFRIVKNAFISFTLISLSAGASAELFDLTAERVPGLPGAMVMTIVARKSVSITGIVLNEGNCTLDDMTPDDALALIFDPNHVVEPLLPITMGMGDEQQVTMQCRNLIQAEFQTTRGDVVYEFSY